MPPATDPARPTVSVVIPTFNRRDRVEAVVLACLAQEGLDEVLVVVDGSTDGTVEALQARAATDPRLRVLAQENQGIVKSRVTGARGARGDIVVFLDDDVLPVPGLIAGHAARHRDGKAEVVLGYMPIPTELRKRGSFPAALYADEYERSVERWEESGSEAILRSFWAGNHSLRRRDLLDLESTVAQIPDCYHEDLAFGLICLRDGLTATFDRSLLAEHLYERDPTSFLRDARRAAEGLVALDAQLHLIDEPIGPDRPVADLRPSERSLVEAAARRPRLKELLLRTAELGASLGATKLAQRLGDLCWRAEQVRTLSGSPADA